LKYSYGKYATTIKHIINLQKIMADTTLAIKTIKNSILNLVSFLVGLAINFYLLRYVVAQIGIDSYGISALLLVIVQPLTLANLGFGEATTKYVSEFIHLGDYASAASYIRTTFFMNLVVGFIGFMLIFFGGQYIFFLFFGDNIRPELNEIISVSIRLVAFGWLANQCSASFMGIPVALQRFQMVATGNILSLTTTAILTYIILQYENNLFGYTLGTIGGQICTFLYWFIIAKILLPSVNLSPKIHKEAWRKSFHYGGWQTLAQIGGILTQQAERFILGLYLTAASVGIYNVAQNIESKIYSIVYKLSEVLFPTFSALSNDSYERKANILIKSSWILTTLAVCLLCSIIPVAHPLINLWMKNVMIANDGEILLQTMCVAGAIGSATSAGYFFLLGVGKTQKITYISVISGVVNVAAAMFIIPKYGLKGAGFSVLLAALSQLISISRVMHTAVKNTIPLSAVISAVVVPILIGISWASLYTFFQPYLIQGWIDLLLVYLFMIVSSSMLIFLITRLLPYGKEHEELFFKLFAHVANKIKQLK
jgi:O-antigen/teichoic acid export membrane protein